MTLLIAYGLLAVGVSFLCSMLEASLLSLPVSYVKVLEEKGSRVGRLLLAMKINIDRPLAAILTLNTIAHTVGAAGVGAQAAVVFGSHVVGIASAVMTLLILVVSEIIPKTLGAVHAKRLAGPTAYATRTMIVVCWPIIVALEWVNRLLGARREAQRLSRAELAATLRLGQQAGALEKREYRVVANLLAMSKARLSGILTPRTVLFALPEKRTVAEVEAEHAPLRFARIPVYRETPDTVTGYVARFDLSRAAAKGEGGLTLRSLARPITAFPEQASAADALESLLEKREHIALVVDEYGGTAGIVTLEDILEELLGQEIVDETDAAVDMREKARGEARLP
ncbi:MAG: CNNM domain-containing protein [Planctomycetota bacterium]|jgi:CBS domain containing-hemolysin-like protein